MKPEIIFKGTQSMGFSLDNILGTVFGTANVDALKTQAQATATSLILNQAGQYVQTNPDAIKAITGAGQESFLDTLDKVWDQYKIPVIIAGVLLASALGYGIYSMIQVGKLNKKSNPVKASYKKKKSKKSKKPKIELDDYDESDIES